ncbi:ADP-ribosylation factor 1-like [Pomacea canaliculata]|uniref:ADP-ribosylation factor 1-like n=1 Tax=Pomacea canaliculata TaxID=400727 RepID=UPI000D726B16|nr:ADP-ribosylation factor 1-like [Pomacea canaliculata]
MGCGAINNKNTIKNSPIKILVLGFSGSGKTYIVYAWSLGLPNLVTTLPTGGDMFNVEKIAIQTSQFMYLWDIGGEMAHRRRSYFPGSQGVVYVVDSSKPSMIDDIVEDLTSLVTDRDLLGLPLLVLANKQDSEGCLTTEQIKSHIIQHVPFPKLCEVCGIGLSSQTDLSHALVLLENLLCQGGIISK